MKINRIFSLLLSIMVAISAFAEELSWEVQITPNDGASVNWLAVKTPSQTGTKSFTLNSFKLFVGYVKSAGGTAWGATTSYMLISKSNESPSSVESSDVVAISTNAPKPANAYAVYNFDGAELEPNTKYFLYWVSSNSSATTYSTTTQRLGLYKQYYEPGIYFSNKTNTDWSPSFSATLTYTPSEDIGDDSGETPSDNVDGVKQILFNNATSSVPYRIPALAQAKNGDMIALSDYRWGKSDIGYGEVDIYAKISKDNGETWGTEFCIAGGTALSGTDDQDYGDASIVADRERNELLVMLVTGNVSFPNSTRDNPIRVACLRVNYDAENNAWTWGKPIDITSNIYDLLPMTKSLFFTSGKICQSKQIKVGDYYRIYCGLDTRPVSGTSGLNHNYVLYSDDFGATWNVLGSNTMPAITSGDECKCEELPNGNVVLSSRVKKGRIFNIFSYSNQQTGEGSWGSQVNPSSSNGGIYRLTDSNPCNGEILLVDAIRNRDNMPVTLALQSIAFNRSIIFFYYKCLETENDYSSTANFASNWTRGLQVSNDSPCYSTMIKQNCNRIGFYFEESIYNSGYNMVYYRYPLETITNGAYSFPPISETLLGDVNVDGKIDISDVVATVSIILGNDNTYPFQYDHVAANMNNDENVDISDVVALVSFILIQK